MVEVSLTRTQVYLDGRDITLLLTELDIDPEVHEELIEGLARPQPIRVINNRRSSGSFTARLFKGVHYTALEEAMAEFISRYSQANGFTSEKRVWTELTENNFEEYIEARQTDDSGTGTNFDDTPGITQAILIRGSRIQTLTLDVLVDSIAGGEGIEITNDINSTTVYIQKADIAVGETKYTLYDAKSGGNVATIPTYSGSAEPDIGANITLTLKTTAAGSNVTVEDNLAQDEIYYIAEQVNTKRHWLEIRATDADSGNPTKVILKYVTLKLASQTTENRTTPSFTVNFTSEDYDIV
jgi:hypothetical protein